MIFYYCHKFYWNFNSLDRHWKWLFSLIIVMEFPFVIAKIHYHRTSHKLRYQIKEKRILRNFLFFRIFWKFSFEKRMTYISTHTNTYISIRACVCVCVCIYIYIYREREREIDIHIYMHTSIYHVCVYA